jgi:two-component system, cell cycle response regulator CtrA
MRILLAEMDHAVAQSIELMLKSEAFNVYTTDLGEEAVDLGKLYDYDMILLGETPDLTGGDMLKSLRLAKVKSPAIVLSRDKSVDAVVRALGTGADDYITLPFHKDELIARIHAVVRRSKGHPVSIVTTGNISVNISTKTVLVDGQSIHFTAKEYAMLELLALRKGTTVSKEVCLNHLYGGMDEPEIKIIDVFVCKIRAKLRKVNGHEIETVWGRGYVMRDPALPNVASPSLAPEIHDMLDRTSHISADYVPPKTIMDHYDPRKRKSPSIVPVAGQK